MRRGQKRSELSGPLPVIPMPIGCSSRQNRQPQNERKHSEKMEPAHCNMCNRRFESTRSFAAHKHACGKRQRRNVEASGGTVPNKVACGNSGCDFSTPFREALEFHRKSCCDSMPSVKRCRADETSEEELQGDHHFGCDQLGDGPGIGEDEIDEIGMKEETNSDRRARMVKEAPRVWDMDAKVFGNRTQATSDIFLTELQRLEVLYLYLGYTKTLSHATVQSFINLAANVHESKMIDIKRADTKLKCGSPTFPTTPFDAERLRVCLLIFLLFFAGAAPRAQPGCVLSSCLFYRRWTTRQTQLTTFLTLLGTWTPKMWSSFGSATC